MEPIVSLAGANISILHNLVLKDVNLTINKGEFVYLIGKTGSGKSSLLKTLYGELPLKEGSGEVASFGLPQIKKKKNTFFKKKIGYCISRFSIVRRQNHQ